MYCEFIKMLTLVNQTNGRDLQPQEEACLHSSKEGQNIVISILNSIKTPFFHRVLLF